MRFFEFEAREIVKRAGVPVTDFGFTRDAVEAAGIAARIACGWCGCSRGGWCGTVFVSGR